MPQSVHDPFAQVKADAGGLLISASVIACIAPVKDSRKVLCLNADAGIFDD